MGILLPTLCVISASFANTGDSLFSSWYQVPRHVLYLGNGSLAVAMDKHGTPLSCFWPSPGYFNHLPQPPADLSINTANIPPIGWSWRTENSIYALHDLPIDQYTFESDGVFLARYTGHLNVILPESKFTQTWVIHPTIPALYSQISLDTDQSIACFYWFADFDPVTSRLPYLAPLNDAFHSRRSDFACFFLHTEKAMVHFRPKDPGNFEWEQAQNLLKMSPQQIDKQFREGIWIAYTTPNDLAAFQCGESPPPMQEKCVSDLVTELTNKELSVGKTYSVFQLIPQKNSEEYSATIITVFGQSYKEILALLKQAAQYRSEEVIHTAAETRQNLLAEATFVPEETIAVLQQNAFLNILAATDKYHFSVVRAPVVEGTYYLERPSETAWAAIACSMINNFSLAENYLSHLATLIKIQNSGRAPEGSMPRAVYSDGTDAIPRFITHVESTCAYLWALWSYAKLLPNEKQISFLQNHQEPIKKSAKFLMEWVDIRSGYPMPSFRPAAFRDTSGSTLLATCAAGLGCAVRLGECLNIQVTSWKEQQERYLLLLQHELKEPLLHTPGFFWSPLIQSSPDRKSFNWSESIEKSLAQSTELLFKLEQLTDYALCADRDPVYLAHIKPIITSEILPYYQTHLPKTSYEAALLIILLASVF